MAKRKPPAGNTVPEWVVTYGDLMSLLLCFFILLAAFSELKQPKEYQKVIDAIKEALGVTGGDSRVVDALDLASSLQINPDGLQLRVEKQKSRSDVNVESTNGSDQTTSTLFNGKRWTIGKPLAFDAGNYELTEENKEILRTLVAPRIRGGSNKFIVLGHAWGVEDRIGGFDFTELSYKRARAAMDFLVADCGVEPKMLDLWVAGDSQPVKIDRAADQGAGNRRVEVFMTEVVIDQLHPDPHGTGRSR